MGTERGERVMCLANNSMHRVEHTFLAVHHFSASVTTSELQCSYFQCKKKTNLMNFVLLSIAGLVQGRVDGPEASTSGASEAARTSCRLGIPGVLPLPGNFFKSLEIVNAIPCDLVHNYLIMLQVPK